MARRLDCDTATGANLRLGPFQVEAISSYERFVQLRSEWDRLFDSAVEAFPTTSHAWLSAWWKTFADGRRPYVILIWNDGVLIGAAPFYYDSKKIFGSQFRVLRPWVNSWVDRFNFLASFPPTEVVEAILDHIEDIEHTWDLVELPRLDRNSEITECIWQSCQTRELEVGVEDDLQSPFLRFPATWDQLLKSLSPSFRQNLKRKIRSVEKMDSVRMTVLDGEECIDPIVEISRESWQHEQGTSIASRQEIFDFYQKVIKAYAQRGQLRCALMEVNGEPAAFELNLGHNRTLHNFKLGFKKKFSHISTGIVLKAFLLKQILDSEGPEPEFMEYDFMGVAEAYKLRWSKKVRVQNRYIVFSKRKTTRRLYQWLYVVKPYVRDSFPALYTLAKKVSSGIHTGRI
ncbi:GNAT family N-acetyltransferase [Marinimicrobium sp. ABcell2]|uniref:GNAT family N-acetyltransferase n=1 Tax=Marinimicrobium sp. ABcell2 TaxID=3069751 RepID=UPI0027B72ABF|nr:GNAT family N-acetyltransferase [Marinimicrobium sp. ABcell2]MDQ2076206.1 GNAT family N-acetyltransferase [Marinimicrobium sp. ABcell2]